MNQLEITYPQSDAPEARPELVKPRLEDISSHAKQLWPDGVNAIALKLLNRSEFKNGCLEWVRGKESDGYGVIWTPRLLTSKWPDGKQWRAHRLSYLLWNGEIPNTLYVLHKCDNPCCILPSHLFLGTAGDNMQDAISKGRHRGPGGEINGKHKLTPLAVSEIRSRYKPRSPGNNMYDLAKEYGVVPCTIHAIIHNQSWK